MIKKRIAQVEIILFKKENNNIQFLLLRRIPEKGGFWQPITGGVEEGETIEEAAKREVYEETHIKIKELIPNVHEFILIASDGKEYKEYVFGVEIKEKVDFTKNIYPEHDEAKFFSYSEALEKLKWPNNKTALTKLNNLLKK